MSVSSSPFPSFEVPTDRWHRRSFFFADGSGSSGGGNHTSDPFIPFRTPLLLLFCQIIETITPMRPTVIVRPSAGVRVAF